MNKNWKQIGFSVFLAILLWAIVTLSSNFYTSIYLPVRVHLSDSTLAVAKISNRFVIVGAQGEGWVLFSYYWGANKYLDVYPEPRTGEHLITSRDLIKKEKLFNSETNIVNISPEILKVEIEKKATKEVYVKPRLSLSFVNKYALVEPPRIIPPKVIISGPQSLVTKTDTVYTKYQELDNLKDSTVFEAELNLPETVNSKTAKVKISLNIQKIVDKQISNVKLKIKGLPQDAELIIFPAEISVNVRGGIEILGKLNDGDVEAYVFYGDAINDTTGSIKPHVLLPEGVELLGVLPNKIEYVIKK